MNRLATGLLLVTAVVLVAFGIWLVVYWVATAFAQQFGAGEAFGIFVGLVTIGLGIGVAWSARSVWRDRRGGWIATGIWAVAMVGLAWIALGTPGPPPVPLPISIGGAVIGALLVLLVLARVAGRRAP